ncbi:hypothetical protein N9N67_08885 [Bacteriovoracaceae bacterium]|nr:hypothetical protein [Bacteriovoracaceae bacterium]
METIRNFLILFIFCAVFYQWGFSQGCDHPHSYPQLVKTYTISDSAIISTLAKQTYGKESLDQHIYNVIHRNNVVIENVASIEIKTIDGYSYMDPNDEFNHEPICDFEVIIKLKNGDNFQYGEIIPPNIYGPAYSTKRLFSYCEGSFIN